MELVKVEWFDACSFNFVLTCVNWRKVDGENMHGNGVNTTFLIHCVSKLTFKN